MGLDLLDTAAVQGCRYEAYVPNFLTFGEQFSDCMWQLIALCEHPGCEVRIFIGHEDASDFARALAIKHAEENTRSMLCEPFDNVSSEAAWIRRLVQQVPESFRDRCSDSSKWLSDGQELYVARPEGFLRLDPDEQSRFNPEGLLDSLRQHVLYEL